MTSSAPRSASAKAILRPTRRSRARDECHLALDVHRHSLRNRKQARIYPQITQILEGIGRERRRNRRGGRAASLTSLAVRGEGCPCPFLRLPDGLTGRCRDPLDRVAAQAETPARGATASATCSLARRATSSSTDRPCRNRSASSARTNPPSAVHTIRRAPPADFRIVAHDQEGGRADALPLGSARTRSDIGPARARQGGRKSDIDDELSLVQGEALAPHAERLDGHLRPAVGSKERGGGPLTEQRQRQVHRGRRPAQESATVTRSWEASVRAHAVHP